MIPFLNAWPRECKSAMTNSVLVIDDVDAALSLMTEMGRAVASEAALRVRDAVLEYAIRRGWAVVAYQTFNEWANRLLDASNTSWIVLDPLFKPDGHNAARACSFRLTRVGQFQRFDYGEGWCHVPEGELGLLDDAAASGLTLLHVSRWLEQTGRTAQRYAVCAANRFAHEAVTRHRPGAKWSQFVSGDCSTLHLRDGCAHLPFAGRRMDLASVTGVAGCPIECRSPPTTVFGSPWHSLQTIAPIRIAVERARRAVVENLSVEVGRPAVVADLPLLGSAVPAWVDPGQRPSANTRLADIADSKASSV